MRWFISVLALAVCFGCAQVTAISEIGTDGSITRQLAFESKGGMSSKATPLSTIFRLPKNGSWKVVKHRKGNDEVAEGTRRTTNAAALSGDITLISKARPLVRNEVSLRDLGNGRTEYVERLRWVGPRLKDDFAPNAVLRSRVKQALPIGASTTQIDAAARTATRILWRNTFGPPNPWVAEGKTNDKKAVENLRRRIAPDLRSFVEERFGEFEAAEITKRLLDRLLDFESPGKGYDFEPADAKKQLPEADLVVVVVRARVPGRVVETNGLPTTAKGEIRWMLASVAPLFEDMTMRVVYEKPR